MRYRSSFLFKCVVISYFIASASCDSRSNGSLSDVIDLPDSVNIKQKDFLEWLVADKAWNVHEDGNAVAVLQSTGSDWGEGEVAFRFGKTFSSTEPWRRRAVSDGYWVELNSDSTLTRLPAWEYTEDGKRAIALRIILDDISIEAIDIGSNPSEKDLIDRVKYAASVLSDYIDCSECQSPGDKAWLNSLSEGSISSNQSVKLVHKSGYLHNVSGYISSGTCTKIGLRAKEKSTDRSFNLYAEDVYHGSRLHPEILFYFDIDFNYPPDRNPRDFYVFLACIDEQTGAETEILEVLY